LSTKNRQIKQQIFGFKELPEQSGTWGMLLPRVGEKQVSHEPEAADIVQDINPAFLKFRNAETDVERGLFLCLGVLMFCFIGTCTVDLLLGPWHQNVGWVTLLFIFSLFFAVLGLAILAIWRSTRLPLPPPILISRHLRKIYAWADAKTGWRVFDYDSLIPAVFFSRIVTGAGAGTVYMLRLCELEPGTRRITASVGPAPARGGPEYCGAAWEFIRRYMDGPPEAVPAVKWHPPFGDKASAWFQIDRDMFIDHIDANHRLKPSLFSWVFVWFWSVMEYWYRIATFWIQRTAPRPPYPPELEAALKFEGPNPYRTIEPVGNEALAVQSKLPHMRLRWNVVRLLATLGWGGLLVAMIYGVLTGK
jgi:hypothetical protein